MLSECARERFFSYLLFVLINNKSNQLLLAVVVACVLIIRSAAGNLLVYVRASELQAILRGSPASTRSIKK